MLVRRGDLIHEFVLTKRFDFPSYGTLPLVFALGQEVVSNDLLTIDETRLAELEKDTVVELHEQGVLIAIHAMMLSLRQYNRLVQLSQHHENSAVKVSLKLAKD